jgi:DNA primase large subunit
MYSSAAHRTTTASATFASGSGSAPEVALFSSKKFPFKLSFYQQSPLDEVTLEQFEEWALDRLRGESRRVPRCAQRAVGRVN